MTKRATGRLKTEIKVVELMWKIGCGRYVDRNQKVEEGEEEEDGEKNY